ncbi:MAG: YdiU family protein [Bacteriovoracaceae bacterium]|nr:YdiU family protein [Bacteriovoracaceae bacterium]
MNNLSSDPDATTDGHDHHSRQVFSGHYVPVTPTPIENPEYVIHSKTFFKELGLSDDLAFDDDFKKAFSADLSSVPSPMHKFGWATGYALSIYGTEYTAQCPFRTGNGYGDGRAISIIEGKFKDKRWEMQLKGGGSTPYCRGADGRAVLRSSVREFLAQEYMHALGIPTSRSLCLFTSKSETVMRPWYSEGSNSHDPDVMVDNLVAITTRVAPSFLRVGQLELFARRTRDSAHPKAYEELKSIVTHLIEREYKKEIDRNLPFEKQIIELAKAFRLRLTSLIANWMRVGYCQGNFNSDNCAAGGFTLDYGPFGFCEAFDPAFQPWTGGGRHFSFFNQSKAAELNYEKFCSAIAPLLKEGSSEFAELDQMQKEFEVSMQDELQKMWTAKLGLTSFHPELFQSLIFLMIETKVDYTIFFRELSNLPENIESLSNSFYAEVSQDLNKKWQTWLTNWRALAISENSDNTSEVSKRMKTVNPKYTWREWLIVPAYQNATRGDYSLIKELQEVLNHPYDEQSKEVEEKFYRLKPNEYFRAGGVSHYSCSS